MKTFQLLLQLLIKCFFISVYEIWSFMKFNEQCQENLRLSEEMLVEQAEHKANMTRTLEEIVELEAELDQVKDRLQVSLLILSELKKRLIKKETLAQVLSCEFC